LSILAARQQSAAIFLNWKIAPAMSLPLPVISPTRQYHSGRRIFRLLTDFTIERPGFLPVVVPTGFESDLSSVPRCLSWFISPDDEGFLEAGIVHDWLYRHGPYSRAQADLIFRELLVDWSVPPYKAWLAYVALRCFGRKHFTTKYRVHE